MNKYRTHNCAQLSENEIGKFVNLSGWLHRKRDHGNLLFIDIRDHYGVTQCVIENNNKFFPIIEKTKPESVIKISGIDKELVGKIASDIKMLKPVEPYKGKGVKYSDERIIRKESKKA